MVKKNLKMGFDKHFVKKILIYWWNLKINNFLESFFIVKIKRKDLCGNILIKPKI